LAARATKRLAQEIMNGKLITNQTWFGSLIRYFSGRKITASLAGPIGIKEGM
jgi:hypothetical protein